MKIKKITTEKNVEVEKVNRPKSFEDFVWQEEIKKVLLAAIDSAKKRDHTLGHILFSWESWFGKTTLSQIIAHQMWVNIKIITWYAFSKPAEMISVLNSLSEWDVLFIDEIHRLKPNLEEVLYTAMEDYAIDMIMPDWANIRVPLNKFTLVWATTKLESLTSPLKNRFVYKFHFVDYNDLEKRYIIERYLNLCNINYSQSILEEISQNIISVPREISNFCIQLRDYLISKGISDSKLDLESWNSFKKWANLQLGWLNHIHQSYLRILKEMNGWPVWLKTISLKLWLNEKAVENDIEPLLLKLWMIEKGSKGRSLI